MSKHANLRLTAKLLTIIAPFIAKNDVRYYLNAINVRPHKDGGAVICATNGHALGAIYDKDAVCEREVTLRFDARMQQACAAGLKNNREVVMLGERLAVVENGTTEVCIQAGQPEVAGLPYPRYERVIPKLETLQPGLIGMFGAPLIALAERAAIIAGKVGKKRSGDYSGMQFFSVKDAPNASVVFRVPAAPEFVGVLMPMRDDYNMPAAPAWVASLPVVDDLASMTNSAVAPAKSTEVPA
jgi:hypothetical protein